MALQPLNIGFDNTGALAIEEHLGPGWRLARTQWRFSRRDTLERHGQTCRIRVSLFSNCSVFHPVNKRPGTSDFLDTDTKFPGESDPPEFAPYTGSHQGVDVAVDGSRCRVSLKLFDSNGDFNPALAWRRQKGKPTFRFSCDLWAKPLRFTHPPTYEEIVAPEEGFAALAAESSESKEPSLGISLWDPETLRQTVEAEHRTRWRRMSLEVHLVVPPPPRQPYPSYVEWWERTFPGLSIVSGGRPESNRRKF